MKIFLVGGAVRDRLLKQEHSHKQKVEVEAADLDYLVVDSSPEEMTSLGYELVGKDFPVFLHPETKDEHALARIERSNGSAYTDFTAEWQGVTIEEDLSRRDLTINAMAQDKDGNLIDLFGGKDDIKNKKLRHVSEAFKEDPVRILRVARFASKLEGFTVADETMELMKDMVRDGMVDSLVSERVWKEWHRAMKSNHPERFFEVLKETGALKILFPVLDKMESIPQRADYHAEGNVFIHTMMVLKESVEISKDLDEDRKLLIRMAALLHDVGKTETPHKLLYHPNGEMRGSHSGHDDVNVVRPLLEDIRDKYKLSTHIHRFVLDVAVFHQRFHQVKGMKKANGWATLFTQLNIKQKADERGEDEYLENMILTCKADAFGRLMTVDNKIIPSKREYGQAEIIKEKFEVYKKSLEFIGDFFTLLQENKIKVEGKNFPIFKKQISILTFENNSYADILTELLTKEQKNILRSKGVDLPVSAKEQKKAIKRQQIEERKKRKKGIRP